MDVDKLGNVTTNISDDDLNSRNIKVGDDLKFSIGTASMMLPFRKTYGNVSDGSPVALVFDGMLQFAISRGNFAATHPVKRGTPVSVKRGP